MRRVDLTYAKDNLESLVKAAIAAGPQRSKIEALISQARDLPDLDTRGSEEILGYNEKGFWSY